MTQTKERLTLTDSTFDALYKLSEGNPGAANVLIQAMDKSPKIDPDCALMEFGPLLSLDSYGIYGSDIWLLYKDCCGQDIKNFLGIIRCVQMGLLSLSEVKDHISNWKKIDCEKYLELLTAQLPNFGKKLNETQNN